MVNKSTDHGKLLSMYLATLIENSGSGFLDRRKATRVMDLNTVGREKDEGIGTCCHFHNTHDRSTSTMHTETLCDLIKFILNINVYFHSMSYINTLHPTIKFTSNYSCRQNLSPFSTSRYPSMTVSLKVIFNTKPTDKHQYLLRPSCRLLLTCITGAL